MKVFLFLLSIIFFIGCSDNPVIEKEKFDIEGRIYQNNFPVPDAKIELIKNSTIIKETITNSEGLFELKDIPQDSYSLNAKKSLENGSFISNPLNVDVNDDLFLDSLKLPDPIILFEPSVIRNNSISLHWSPYTMSNFYEYKVYRHNTSGIDQTTATLIHISTNNSDTTFTDEGIEYSGGLSSNTKYFYRVYVNNNFGQLSGSNIIDVTTSNWDNDDNFSVFYSLTKISSFPGFGGIIWGIDYDGQYLWILEVREIGGYYDNNHVNLIQYDYESDTIVKNFEYEDEYIVPKALAYSDGSLYVLYNWGNLLKKISATTGEIEREYSFGEYEGLSIHSGNMYGTRVDPNRDFIHTMKLSNFDLINTQHVPVWQGIIAGIAKRNDEIWLSSRFDGHIIILNDIGEHIGVIKQDATFSHLCFLDDMLVIAKRSRVNIYQIDN